MPAVTADELPRGALTGKVGVVVGGASGIGRMVARALAKQGARVVVADFDAARMERTVEELLRLGSADAVLALPTDVRSESSVRSLVGDAIKAMQTTAFPTKCNPKSTRLCTAIPNSPVAAPSASARRTTVRPKIASRRYIYLHFTLALWMTENPD